MMYVASKRGPVVLHAPTACSARLTSSGEEQEYAGVSARRVEPEEEEPEANTFDTAFNEQVSDDFETQMASARPAVKTMTSASNRREAEKMLHAEKQMERGRNKGQGMRVLAAGVCADASKQTRPLMEGTMAVLGMSQAYEDALVESQITPP